MLAPKTIAMNAAKAPHWTLYRRTANRRNQPRTIPMRMRPSWLMSIAFPRRMGEIPRIPDKGVGAVLTRNNDAALGKPATRLNYPRATCPPGDVFVRFDRLSGVSYPEPGGESVLHKLRGPVGYTGRRHPIVFRIPASGSAWRPCPLRCLPVLPASSTPCDCL